MKKYVLGAILFVFTVMPATADETKGYFDFSKDRFLAGATTVQDTENVDDLFMIGETVRSEQDIAGSAHLLARKIVSNGAIGGDAYLAGLDVSQNGKVTGDTTMSGYNVHVGAVAGDLRISGANLTLSGPVDGYALVAGDEVRFESVIKGDVSLAARETKFADNARIEGTLTVYEDKIGKMEIPAHVIAPDQIERRNVSEWSVVARERQFWDWRSAISQFFTGVIFVAVIAALIAAFVPTKLAELRRNILAQPFRNVMFGFLALSVIIGSTIILMMSVVGLFLAPATVMIALAGTFAGYVVGAYAVGVALLLLMKRPEPDSIGTRALAAGIGALTIAVIALVPILGWLVVLAVALAGIGSIALWLFRPKFFATA